MDKNRTIITSTAIICVTIAFLGYLTYLYYKFKDKVIYSEYTFCIRSAMEKSKENGHPYTIEDAERVCAKFNN